MNVLITLPANLLDKIISGEKSLEMRKSRPNNFVLGVDGFFVVEKGTDKVRCWCRVDAFINTVIYERDAECLSDDLCFTPQFILEYAPFPKDVWLWGIGKVVELENVCRDSLHVERNPHQFAYCPLSYGESF